MKKSFSGLREAGNVYKQGAHTHQVDLNMSTMGRHLKYNLMWTSSLAERSEVTLTLAHPFFFSLEESCLLTKGKQSCFLDGYSLEAELSKSTSVRPHWLCNCSFFMGCNHDLAHEPPSAWPRRAVYTLETQEGDTRSQSWRLCSDHFVLFVFSLEQSLPQTIHQGENILRMQAVCTKL